ncbi:asparagine synthase C-terminal domain-containing protein [Candidatus Woesearchaeota archaeon]|nr:asparagine synthase C-terminal domain-containing protein [Candidatus Woesearchaeota archaeon]
MSEIFLENNKLVPEQKWVKKIDLLSKDNAKVKSKEQSLKILDTYLSKAIEKRMEGIDNFGIFFSGGIDSTLIAFFAKKLKKNFTCYSVGLENSQDLEWAEKVAGKLGFNLKSKKFILEEAEKIIKKTVKIVGPNVVKAGVGAVVIAAYEISKKEKIFFSGLGSEELFAGYERHALSKNVDEECISGLKSMWERDLTRDAAIAEKLGFEIRTPFLDEDLITNSLRIPAKFKISKEQKKIILREFAEKIGMPKEFAWRKKIAAQYGSRFDKAIEKLAKKNKIKTKKEYLSSL